MRGLIKRIFRVESLVVIIFIFLFVAIALIVILDRDNVEEVIHQANPISLLWALLFTFTAYSFMTLSFVLANKLFKLKVATPYIALVGFITIAIGNLLDFGGLGGYSLRVTLLKQKGARISEVMASSLFHVYVTFFTLLMLLPLGFLLLLFTGKLSFPAQFPLVYIMGVTVFAIVLVSWLLIARRARNKIEEFLSKLSLRITKRDFSGRFHNFNEALNTGLDNSKANPKLLTGMFVTALVGWIFAITAMGFCFHSIGVNLHPAALTAGFGVGVTVAYFAVIPGGLGVQDTSMAGVYTLFGVPFDSSVFASIVLRVVYYLVPAVLGLGAYALFMKKTLKNGNHEQKPEGREQNTGKRNLNVEP